MGLRSQGPVTVPILTPVHCKKRAYDDAWVSELDHGAMEEGESRFLSPGERWQQDALWQVGKLAEAVCCFSQYSAGNLGSWH